MYILVPSRHEKKKLKTFLLNKLDPRIFITPYKIISFILESNHPQ